jgi:alpha-beta hydrolase superfamily lysophospholipase
VTSDRENMRGAIDDGVALRRRAALLGAASLVATLLLGCQSGETPSGSASAPLRADVTPPNIELRRQRPSTVGDRGPLLLIPGAYHGAWAFENNLLPFFAARGFDTYAMSLRGHGQSDGADRVLDASFDDYVQDVVGVARALRRPPIVVGHSLGGLLARRLMEVMPVRAAVLLATPTPRSMREGALRLLLRYPGPILRFALNGDPDVIYRDRELVRDLLFSGAHDPVSEAALGRLLTERESKRILKDVQSLVFQRPALPVLAMGGSADTGVPASAIVEAATHYAGEHKMIEGASHQFFMAPGWERAAQCVADWLDARAGA